MRSPSVATIDPHVRFRPVLENEPHLPTVLRCDVEPTRLSEDVRELPAGLTHGGCVDQRHQLVDILDQRAVKESFVPRLQGDQEDVPLDVVRLAAKVLEHSRLLCLLVDHLRRQ